MECIKTAQNRVIDNKDLLDCTSYKLMRTVKKSSHLIDRTKQRMVAYSCRRCRVAKIRCLHGDITNCEQWCESEWDMGRKCNHNIECFVCGRVWKGDRTLCLHSTTDVVKSFMTGLR